MLLRCPPDPPAKSLYLLPAPSHMSTPWDTPRLPATGPVGTSTRTRIPPSLPVPQGVLAASVGASKSYICTGPLLDHEALPALTLPSHPIPLCPQCCHISSGNASLLPSRLPLLLPYGLERPKHQHLRLSSLLLRALQADQDAYPSPHIHLAQVYRRDSVLVCSSHALSSLGSHKRARTQRDPSAEAGSERDGCK